MRDQNLFLLFCKLKPIIVNKNTFLETPPDLTMHFWLISVIFLVLLVISRRGDRQLNSIIYYLHCGYAPIIIRLFGE